MSSTITKAIERLPTEKPLSAQEALVVRYLAEGLTYPVIATTMRIGERTAKEYSARARAKLGCRSSREMVRLVLTVALSSEQCSGTN